MSRGPGGWVHLARRFFQTLTAPELTSEEVQRVEELLRPGEGALFWAQSRPDRRHAVDSLTVVEACAPRRTDLQRAALLHDVGKRHARLGVIGRSLASVVAKLGIPVGGRFAAYRDHGSIGADELAELGVEPLVAQFARHHHRDRPPGVGPVDWELLQRADGEGG